MKTSFALTLLSTKIFMLLCVSCMGVFGVMQEVSAQELPPCHQAAAAEENTSGCDMCQTALEAWEEKAVPVEEIITEIPEPQLFSTLSSPTFIFVSKLPTSLYLSYSPPPQAALKAVTPNTKTIVLLS